MLYGKNKYLIDDISEINSVNEVDELISLYTQSGGSPQNVKRHEHNV